MKKTLLMATLLMGGAGVMSAQTAITPKVLSKLASQEQTAADVAIRNAMSQTSLNQLATDISTLKGVTRSEFSYQVNTKGITNQKQSGRCWLFTGLNVLRSQAINKHNLQKWELSQVYLFFFDQLEKSNLFLQGVIDTADKPFDDRFVDWLFSNPLSDGGTFTGVADLVEKYGVVPKEAMPETYSSNNTSQIASQMKWQLRDYGMQLRKLAAAGSQKKQLEAEKVRMLGNIYHILTLAYGVPPTEFRWEFRTASGNLMSDKTYTPKEFYKELWGDYNLNEQSILIMNDPSREYGKVYRIQYDRHTYDGHDWGYLNLPMEQIKPIAIEMIKNNEAMYISCDVGKFLNRSLGTCDMKNFDFKSILGIDLTMDKRERILTHASGSSHAMTLIAVDVDAATKAPLRWMVENSWGKESGFNGNLIMTDEWFDEYMFRFVFDKKYVPADILKMTKQEPILLPSWDPMFAVEE
ncbi:MAG: C1 family peptidase [Muribaculaceae bacterium]